MDPGYSADCHPRGGCAVPTPGALLSGSGWIYPALVDRVTLTDSGFADHLLSNSLLRFRTFRVYLSGNHNLRKEAVSK